MRILKFLKTAFMKDVAAGDPFLLIKTFAHGLIEHEDASTESVPTTSHVRVEAQWKTSGDGRRLRSFVCCLLLIGVAGSAGLVRAQSVGRISGTVIDQGKAVIPGASVTLFNRQTGAKQSANTDGEGSYAFPVVAVGEYDIEITAAGFRSYRRANLVIDINSAAHVDVILEVASHIEQIAVTEDANVVRVEVSDTQLGQVIPSKKITEVPLNGRSYTDLLAIQAGVSPITTSGAGNSTSGGGFGTVPVAGNDSTGQFSIHGQRESANGFYLNGASVQESVGQQAGIIPNLDSIAEFRILSGNTDAEFGGYSGGLINVLTRAGSNLFHGSAFEFLRNTHLDARGYFSPERSTFHQNQYGGTLGGPIKHDKVFFFGDYQGQRLVQGIETGIVSVPSLADRSGNFTDSAATLSGTVNGTHLAQTLTNRLGYPVTNGESFYVPGCTSSSQCVFPNAVIPQAAFSVPAQRMIEVIPSPNFGLDQFSSGSQKRRINDDKGSGRIDVNSARYGNFSAYYFADKYNLDDPYPSGFGGATVPGPTGAYDALSSGLDQVVVLRDTKTFGSTTVNESHFSFTRLNNDLGVPKGGVGVSLADQGISNGPQGIKQGFPAYAGVETLYFNSFTVGANPFFLQQVNNTLQLADNFSKVAGGHTIKLGGQYIWFRVTQVPDLVANGTFSFFGSGNQSTGNGFADFLLGLPDFYSQQSSPPFYESAATGDLFVQDSWRVRPNLTLNYGGRWDYITPWSEEYHQITTFVQGVNSATFPGAPTGYLVPGDPLPDRSRIPSGIAPTPLNNFSPRLGLAYSPNWSSGLLEKLTGGPEKTSIRIGAGRFFTSAEGLTVAYPTGNPPYGLTYTSPEPPQMDQPFIGALTGTNYIQQFPVNVPPHTVSPTNPDSNVDWSRYTPISGAGSVWYKNKTPYTMSFNISLERQIGSSTLASAGYVGAFGRHLLTVHAANPGIPALCLSLSKPEDVAPGTPTCGPFGENGVYTRSDGTVVNGTRAPFPNTIGTDAYYENIGNSRYHGLELTLQRKTGALTWLASYTYSKSIDQTSSMQEQVDPFDYHRLDGISAFDIKHNFVVSYSYELPFSKFLGDSRWTNGWAISGVTRFASGLPVTFASFGDNYLVQVQNNGVNSVSLDMPNCASGDLQLNHNPRNGLPYFNTSLFAPNAFGTQGNCKRRMFYGPGMDNFDMVLRKLTRISEGKTIELRFETFNTFNHAQFYPNGSVDGNINSPTFGKVLKAAPPRIGQLALKFTF
ncbi:MAG: carboxypeptidase regulatory-like domain-containing protein [Acidobacteria bacterium]|nr:carboxypeptidase regulatory-like domain-containing protein [Acidobacteriota bacterium]